MRVLFLVLVIACIAIAGSATAVLLIVRRHRMRLSDEALRRELEQIEREHGTIHSE